jgi:hypothetical protein
VRVKKLDEYANTGNPVTEQPASVLNGRTLEQLDEQPLVARRAGRRDPVRYPGAPGATQAMPPTDSTANASEAGIGMADMRRPPKRFRRTSDIASTLRRHSQPGLGRALTTLG